MIIAYVIFALQALEDGLTPQHYNFFTMNFMNLIVIIIMHVLLL